MRGLARKPLGFTLLEIIMAAILFAGMSTVLTSIWVLHAKSQQKTGQLLVAADLAEGEMNRLLALPYHAIVGGTSSASQTWTIRDQSIRHEYTIQSVVVAITFLDVKFIRVIVSYEQSTPGGEPGQYVVDSFIASEAAL